MHKTYPYIKDKEVKISSKFIRGDREQSLPLNGVQQLMSSLEIDSDLAEICKDMRSLKAVYEEAMAEGSDPINPKDVLADLRYIADKVNDLKERIKPYCA